MKKPNKYITAYIIQTNFGYGWDDDTQENTYKEAREQLKTYRNNSFGRFAARLIQRRELNLEHKAD